MEPFRFTVEQNKSLNDDDNSVLWQNFDAYPKSEYLMRNAPDCSFIVGSGSNLKHFTCNKWILQCVSPVFKAMINGNSKEAKSSNDIRLTDTEPAVFQKFLDFIYYGRNALQHTDIAIIVSLIYLSNKYLINSLTGSCIATMHRKLKCIENHDLISVFEYGYLVDDKKLIDRCKQKIRRRAKVTSSSELQTNIDSYKNDKKRVNLKPVIGASAVGTSNFKLSTNKIMQKSDKLKPSQNKPQPSHCFSGLSSTSTYGRPTTSAFGAKQEEPSFLGRSFLTATSTTTFRAPSDASSLFCTRPIFGAQAAQSTLFRQSAFEEHVAAGEINAGTSITKYQPTIETSVAELPGWWINVSTKMHCLTAMKEYKPKSFEELRLEDYLANRKTPQKNRSASCGLTNIISIQNHNL